MTRHAGLVLVFLIVLPVGTSSAQEKHNLVLDLAQTAPGSTAETRIPKDEAVRLRIQSLLPRRLGESPYSIIVNLVPYPIPELPKLGGPRSLEGDSLECSGEWTALVDLKSATEEEEVRIARDKLETLRIRDPENPCAAEAARWLLATYREIALAPIPQGMQYEVVIQRGGKVWKAIYTPGPRGSWDIHFGAAFVPDVFSEEDEFVTAEGDSAGRFVIREGRDVSEIRFVPATFFSWYPSEDDPGTWTFGLTAALGFDLEDPVILVGGSATYNRNIMISTGFAAHKLRKLAPRFSEGQEIATLLDPDQLHEEVFRVNPFVAVSFRLGENPFGGEKKSSERNGGESNPAGAGDHEEENE